MRILMRDMLNKLLSRKLLVVVVACVAAFLNLPGMGGEQLQEVIMAYIGGQALVDGAAALKNG
tara:strand:- start:154 stop:342 length:189 start_codon:yes stop_codon:yes gene_type:complete